MYLRSNFVRNLRRLSRTLAPFPSGGFRLRRPNRRAKGPSRYARPAETIADFAFWIVVVYAGWVWWNHAVWHTYGGSPAFWVGVGVLIGARIIFAAFAPRRKKRRRRRRILPGRKARSARR